MKRRTYLAVALAGLFCVVGVWSASAAVTTGSMSVSAYVYKPITLSVYSMGFGTIYAGGTLKDAAASIYVTAAPGMSYKIGLRQGLHYGLGFRHLQAGTDTVNTPYYLLYKDSLRTSEWGDTGMTGANYTWGDPVSATGSGASQLFTVYGRLPSISSSFAGVQTYYYDTVQVAVEY